MRRCTWLKATCKCWDLQCSATVQGQMFPSGKAWPVKEGHNLCMWGDINGRITDHLSASETGEGQTLQIIPSQLIFFSLFAAPKCRQAEQRDRKRNVGAAAWRRQTLHQHVKVREEPSQSLYYSRPTPRAALLWGITEMSRRSGANTHFTMSIVWGQGRNNDDTLFSSQPKITSAVMCNNILKTQKNTVINVKDTLNSSADLWCLCFVLFFLKKKKTCSMRSIWSITTHTHSPLTVGRHGKALRIKNNTIFGASTLGGVAGYNHRVVGTQVPLTPTDRHTPTPRWGAPQPVVPKGPQDTFPSVEDPYEETLE